MVYNVDRLLEFGNSLFISNPQNKPFLGKQNIDYLTGLKFGT